MKFLSILLITFVTFVTNAQDNPAYKIFTGEGKKADYHDMLKQSLKADVVFFGELHDNPIAHWLELELTKDLHAEKGNNLILAAEMFETDNQLVIDEYFADIIKESSFESEARLWKNYSTDYKPLVSFAKKNNLSFVASNIPRRYASLVSTGGFDALQKVSEEGKKYIAPLPVEYDPELPCYKDMLTMNMGPKGPAPENFPKAQAIKDATMANSIVKYRQSGQMVIHYNGSYHSDRYQGILWYLNKYSPSTKSLTITTVIQDSIGKMSDESRNKADFVIVIPTSMTRTYK
ncbi:MAG: iron-regulated protein [Bacteroidetes bacterium GWF2_41_9]|nr:MAG: iron-regulated protein [Bacteroidetes bacterium GWF2_41_9]HAM09979.1 iron-regulated protein [Bacteroidales bacterium]